MTHIIFLIAMFCTIPSLNKKAPFYILTFSTLFLFLALRYNYGNDYLSYFTIHNQINSGMSAWGENDTLFKYLNLTIKNFYWLIAFISMFYIVTIYYLNEYWISIFLLLFNPYLFLIHLSSLRQTIAICFIIWAVNLGIKRGFFSYLILILIACGFHKSAIVMLPLYFFMKESKIKKNNIITILIILTILMTTPLLNSILNKIIIYFPNNYKFYLEQGLQNSITSTLISGIFFIITILNINKLDGKSIVYGKLYLVSTIISILAFKVSMISRIGMYFDVFMIIAIPNILSKVKNRLYKSILLITIISICILRYVLFFTDPIWNEAYGTYRTILTN